VVKVAIDEIINNIMIMKTSLEEVAPEAMIAFTRINIGAAILHPTIDSQMITQQIGITDAKVGIAKSIIIGLTEMAEGIVAVITVILLQDRTLVTHVAPVRRIKRVEIIEDLEEIRTAGEGLTMVQSL